MLLEDALCDGSSLPESSASLTLNSFLQEAQGLVTKYQGPFSLHGVLMLIVVKREKRERKMELGMKDNFRLLYTHNTMR